MDINRTTTYSGVTMKMYIMLISMVLLGVGCNQQIDRRTTWDDLRYAKLRVLQDAEYTNRPIILISTDHPDELSAKVLVAIWQGGRIVWSKDQKKGGKPYYQGNISSNAVAAFLSDLEKKDYFSDIYLNYPELGCDVRSTIISIYEKHPRPHMEASYLCRILCMESAHELYPSLQEQRTNRYLKKWKYVHDRINSLIPHEGKEINFNYRIGFAPLFCPDKIVDFVMREK